MRGPSSATSAEHGTVEIVDVPVAYALEPVEAYGSTAAVVYDRVMVSVNPWDGAIVRSDLDAGTSDELVVGGEPTRITQIGGEFWVSLRAARRVLVLRDEGGLARAGAIDVGAEPFGVVGTTVATSTFHSHKTTGSWRSMR